MAAQTPSRRYRQISRVLARHGLGFFVSVLGLERFVTMQRLFNRQYDQPLSRPEHVRKALEELGPAFIKLGQILSTRADLLPPNYQLELARLQDAAPPLEVEVVKAILAEELDMPLESAFASFDEIPLAAGSIGQVHGATLQDGSRVVVKVQRPGVSEQIEQDLQILESLALTARRRWALIRQYDVMGIVNEFSQTLRAETNYLLEARNAERFRTNFANDEAVHIPRVFWERVTKRVLTLERIDGIKIDDLDGLDRAGLDRRAVALVGARMVMKMIFHDGFFHADPHPGNFFIEPNGRLGVVDFGMVGTVEGHMQEQLVWALIAYTGDEPERQVDALFDLGVARGRVDRALLRRDIEHLRTRYYGRPVGEIAIRPVVNDVLGVVRRHRLQLPPGYALLVKTVVMHESLVSRLDPGFDFTGVLVPYARRMVMRQFSPVTWARALTQAGIDVARLGVEVPQQARRLLGALQRGDLEIAVRPAAFEPLLRRLERIANRMVLGIIAAAFVIALAVLISAFHLRSDPAAGLVLILGFLAASALGGYVAISILRSGRP